MAGESERGPRGLRALLLLLGDGTRRVRGNAIVNGGDTIMTYSGVA